MLIAAYLVASIVVTWPQATFLARGRVPNVRDVASYVWSLWWLAHQVVHLGNPWFTGYMAAPVGIQLGFDTLMPLPGLIMTPITLLFGRRSRSACSPSSPRRCCATPCTARPGSGSARRAPSPPGPSSAWPA